MVKCPRCSQPVDETVRTTCPLCFTPLATANSEATPAPPGGSGPLPQMPAAAPYPQTPAMPQPPMMGQPGGTGGLPPMPHAGQPQPMPMPQMGQPTQAMNAMGQPPMSSGIPGLPPQGAGGSGIPGLPAAPMGQAPPPLMPGTTQPGTGRRVSLTGEVIEDTPAPPPSYAGGGVGGPMPPRPAGPGAPSRSYASTMRVEREPARSGGGAGAAIAVILLLVLGGFGGWYFLSHRGPTPEQQVNKAIASLKTMDLGGLYDTVEMDKAKFPTKKDFLDKTQAEMDKLGPMKDMVTSIFKMMEVKTGTATINGDEATVPTTTTVSFMGQSKTSTSDVKLKKVDGIWKIESKGNSGMFGGLGGGGFGGGRGGAGGFGGGGMMGAPSSGF